MLLLSSFAALIMRRSVPELSSALSTLGVCTALAFAAVLIKSLGELRQSARTLYGAGDARNILWTKPLSCR